MHAISVIIPSYNAAAWLPKTIGKLEVALQKANIEDYEIIVVNDGSSDNTKEVLADLHNKNKRILAINQDNKGRFLARKIGVDAAKKEFVLFIDSRVYADEGSLKYVVEKMRENPNLVAWNGHVRSKLGWNVFARFWDAVTFIAWRRYRRNPRLVQYGIEDFDYYPKGTTLFLAPRTVLKKYIEEFSSNIQNMKFVSDDTALLRNVARDIKIAIGPGFSCLYHSRDKLSAFIKHTLNRGTFFADGFFQPGNRFFVPLIGFLIVSPLFVISLLAWPVQVVGVGLCLWLTELLVALALGVPVASALSLWIVSPIFAIFYGLGIWRGVLLISKQKLHKNKVSV